MSLNKTLGLGSFIRLAKQTSGGYGTPISSGSLTNSLRVSSCTLQEQNMVEAFPVLYQGGNRDGAELTTMRRNCTGRLEMPLMYAGMGYLLAAAMGKAPTTTGSGPYTHTYTRGDDWADLFLTLEAARGKSGLSDFFDSVCLPRWGLSIRDKQVAMFTADLLAKKRTARTTSTSPSFAAGLLERAIYAKHVQGNGSVATFAWNGTNYPFTSLELSCDNKLEGTGDVADEYIAEPEPSAPGEVTVNVTLLERPNDNFLGEFGNSDDFVLEINDGTQEFNLTVADCQLVSHSDPIQSTGRVPISLTFRAAPTGTTSSITIVGINGQSTYGAN